MADEPNDREVLVVDAANVIGSRPTGWWRDRPGAARTFTARVRAAARVGAWAGDVVVVLEGQSRRGVDEGTADRVQVVHASGVGDDTIVAGAGADRVDAGLGDDTVYLGAGRDFFSAASYRGAGDDHVFGEAGNDFLHTGRGADRLYGGDGDDVLDGGSGNDRLTGGAGADAFHFYLNSGQDVIADFDLDAGDRIHLSAAVVLGPVTFADGMGRIGLGGDAAISLAVESAAALAAVVEAIEIL